MPVVTFCLLTALPDEGGGFLDEAGVIVSESDGILRFRDFCGVGWAELELPDVAAEGAGSATSLVEERVTLGDMRIWICIGLHVWLI